MENLQDVLTFDRRKFKVAIICALAIESTAVEASLDEIYNAYHFGKAPGDTNAYTLGRIGYHHVVLTYLPSMGKASSALAAAGLRTSFNNIRLSLLVGICGGVPFRQEQGSQIEILLGDIVISTGAIQYDLGRQYDASRAVRKTTLHDSLSRLPAEIRALIHKSRAGIERRNMQERIQQYITQICSEKEFTSWKRPDPKQDILYPTDYVHRHRTPQHCVECQSSSGQTCSQAREATCEELGCSIGIAIARSRHIQLLTDSSTLPESQIHWGLIASGDLVLKSGNIRDAIANEEHVIAFEMEGAGLWEAFPTVIVKGVCDYADSHKHKSWQRFAAVAAAAGAKALLSGWVASPSDLAHKLDQQLPLRRESSVLSESPVPTSKQNSQREDSPAWLVPFDRRANLVGRSVEKEQIEKTLFSSQMCEKIAVEGLGGIGKSRLALEIAYSTRECYPMHSVLWIQCSDVSSFERDCRKIAHSFDLPGASDLSQDPKVLVKQHLDQDEVADWLLILDNADDESLWSAHAAATNVDALINYIPRGRPGAVLATTRNHKVASDIAQRNVVKLTQLSQADSQLMLRDLLQQPKIMAETHATSRLLDHLIHLPLAIVQAAAFINQNSLSIVDYLQAWNDSSEDEIIEILSEDFTDDSRYRDAKNPVAKTWLISFKEISTRYPLAATLLSYMAALDPKDMLKSSIPQLSASRLEQNKAFGTLQSYAFIQAQQRESSDTTFDMHRLVHLATRNHMRQLGEFSKSLKLVAKQLCTLLPKSGLDPTSYWQQYLPHAEKVVATPDIADEDACIELEELLSSAHYQTGAYVKALAHRRAVVDKLRRRLESDQVRIVLNLAALSEILCQLGRFQDSTTTAEEAFKLSKEVLRDDNPRMVRVMECLAESYGCSGKCEEALQLSLETVELAKKCVYTTEEHKNMNVISALHTLAINHHCLRRYPDQVKVLLETLEWAKKLTDPSPIDKAQLEMELAAAYCRLGKADVAERLLLPIRHILEAKVGKLHRLTLSSISCLAEAYQFQKRYHEAELLYREVLSMCAEVGRRDDAQVLRDHNQLAYIVLQQGRFQEAKEMQLKAIGMTTMATGKDSVLTLHSLEALAQSYWFLDKREQATAMMVNCHKRSALTLGPKHPDTRNRLKNLQRWKASTNTILSRKRHRDEDETSV